jgi:hypothetical protein
MSNLLTHVQSVSTCPGWIVRGDSLHRSAMDTRLGWTVRPVVPHAVAVSKRKSLPRDHTGLSNITITRLRRT